MPKCDFNKVALHLWMVASIYFHFTEHQWINLTVINLDDRQLNLANKYMFKAINRNTKKKCEICSKLQ